MRYWKKYGSPSRKWWKPFAKVILRPAMRLSWPISTCCIKERKTTSCHCEGTARSNLLMFSGDCHALQARNDSKALRSLMDKVINDFSIIVGTKNGSGSSTANNTILRAIFKMGIPVSGKNLFPSNIQGLPTWYTIRASKDGFLARREEQEIVVAMNPDSFARDLASVAPGGAFFYADDIKQPISRADVAVYPLPIKQIVRSDPSIPSDFRDLVGNMVYVGALAQMIDMDVEKIRAALSFHFKGKQKPIDMNFNTVKAGAEWAKANLE